MISSRAGAHGISAPLLLWLSPSLCSIQNPLPCFFSYLTGTTRPLSSNFPTLLRNGFLDITPKPRPDHCQTQGCYQTKQSDDSQFYLSFQEDKAKDFGFFYWLVSHLNLCPEIYYENASASRPSGLEDGAIFHFAQLQFLQGFLSDFSTGSSLHLWDPLHSSLAASTLLWTVYWAGYPEAQIINFVVAQAQEINSKIGRIILGHKLYRQGITPSPGNWSTLIQKPFSGHSGLGALHRVSWEPDTLSEINGRGEDT